MKLLCLLLLLKVIVAQRDGIRLPAEWEPHERTFLCWPQSEDIWGRKLLPLVRKDIAAIANAIVEFEPVVMLVDPNQISGARRLLDSRITIQAMKLDDLWARDTLPVFVEKKSNAMQQIMGVIFNFNGWGRKQYHRNDAKVAEKLVRLYGMEERYANIVGEGGSFETDGKGTLLVTESSVVNRNRNEESKAEIEKELKRVLGMRKVIWFKGVKSQDITDAHVDCLVRFVKPGTVILNRSFPGEPESVWSISSDEALTVLNSSTDADGNPFEVVEMFEPDPSKIKIVGNKDTFLSSYVNFLIGNGFVIVPKFGDPEADLKSQTTLQRLFPGRVIVPVEISALASGGGGIHCATHEQPTI